MTREEAKQAIDYYYCHTNLLDEYGDYCDQTEYEKAFEMAIKALEQEPCDDCISREEAIKACLDGWNKGYKEILEDIRNLPSVNPSPCDWIPVSERLPEKRGSYLVTQKAIFPGHILRRIVGYALNLHDVDEYDFKGKKRPGWYEYDIEWGYRELEDITAWMPLPEPYKAESEGKE